MIKTFFENPDFVSYLRLLGKLHDLIQRGHDEGPEGEELRDRMDAPGARLSHQERGAVKDIAADFHSLTESGGDLRRERNLPGERGPAEDLVRFVAAARDSQRFLEALELVRQCEHVLPPAHVADLRAAIWEAAHEPSIARMFSDRAAQLRRHEISLHGGP